RAERRNATSGNGPLFEQAAATLGPEELFDNARALLFAGHETGASALTWTLWLLAHDLDAQARVADEVRRVAGNGPIEAGHFSQLAFSYQVWSEALRLFPPGPITVRETREDVDLGDVHIPAGGVLALCYYALHRHERLWDAPNVFRPDRFGPSS